MPRWPVRLLLPACAGLLLSFGCSRVEETPARADTAKDEKAGPFTLPADEGGKMLARILPPPQLPAFLQEPDRPAPTPFPERSVEPMLPLRVGPTQPPRLPAPPRKETKRPDSLPDETFGEVSPGVTVPREPSFATDRPARVESEDVSIPPPLPVLATQLPDRVPVEDATQDASTAAVRSKTLPERATPTPYGKVSVPDPFEHREPLGMPTPEESTPPEALPRPPR